ncbi:MAG TPA: hypothetical protein GX709_00185 [Clostridiales bacterium]|nr:hypothetical protein [Clostridiales bacterium]
MDNNSNNSMVDYGRWVPVDENQLGFKLPPIPSNQPVAGPDGSLYCVGDSKPELTSVGSNTNNAIPTPSSIVQMPSIVQPIALVPYTSQNQPMLQYDPYSRPVEPEGAPKAPVYIKKPYRPISITAFVIALIAAIVFLLFSVVAFQGNSAREAYKANGIELMKAVTDVFNKDSGTAYASIIAEKDGDSFGRIVVYALPFLAIIVEVFLIILALKYLIRFFTKKSPRSFSVLAFLNIILTALMFIGLLIMSNAEVATDARSYNTRAFFALEATPATIMGKWALGFAFVASIVLFIIPFFARKNAYMVERDDPANKTYIISAE